MSDIVLTGLDGTNPLGFMAALGTLGALTDRSTQAGVAGPRLSWRNDGAWFPVVRGPENADALVSALLEDLGGWRNEPALDLKYQKPGKESTKLAWDLKPPPDRFVEYLKSLVAECGPDARRSVDFSAAFATDVAKDNNGNTKPTALHFTAGNQEFLKTVGELLNGSKKESGVGEADLREALFGPWRYQRTLKVFRWDGTGARAYALRATNPENDQPTGVPGADWLAFRGLSFFTAVPRKDRILTTACFGGWKTGSMRWPLWSGWLDARAASTALSLNLAEMSARERNARGIALVLESAIRRSDQGGYGSFTPPKVV